MKKRSLFVLIALVSVFSMLLAACQPQATAVPMPEPTTAPEPTATTAPEPTATTEAAPAYEGMVVDAGSCDYGGEFKSIEAIDESTVKFTLCFPDPAFPSKVAFDVFSIVDKDYLDKVAGDAIAMSDAPVGTGPWKLVEWKRGDSIVYEATRITGAKNRPTRP